MWEVLGKDSLGFHKYVDSEYSYTQRKKNEIIQENTRNTHTYIYNHILRKL